jgi:two-component system chemotaxis response regulator CheB
MTILRKLRVLVVDDSPVMQALISRMLTTMPEVEVIGTASDAFQAREMLVQLAPDVMTLDIDMPKLDGLAFLDKVMKHFPTPTIVVSARAVKGSDVEKRALEVGAIRAIEKPKVQGGRSLQEASAEICAAVLEAGKARSSAKFQGSAGAKAVQQAQVRNLSAEPAIPESILDRSIIAIASSTGGTEALKVALKELPAEVPPIVVVQHMPPMFTAQYAGHLQEVCSFQVREAKDGDLVKPGQLLLAPGDFHMEVQRRGGLRIRLHQETMLHGVRPAADYLFESVAKTHGARALGVILTGMGRDGAAGLLSMKKAGAATMVQDEKTSVVFGMPKAAIDLGAVDQVVRLERIAAKIMDWVRLQATLESKKKAS